MADLVVVIFIEGDTEEEFYSELIKTLRQKSGGRFNCCIKIKNVKGVGNYKNKVGRIFEKKIKVDFPNSVYKVILCYDTDIFELAQKPFINWSEVIKDLKGKGANQVKKVLAKKSIEDWFLYDYEGICKYLKIPKDTKVVGDNGLKKMQNLFIKGKKTYIKGQNCSELIKYLDMEKILCNICEEIKHICLSVGINNCSNNKLCK